VRVVIGMGKSGHIGNKIAATLASTGTPAFFVHPGEASHGDLGMITPKDVVLALSNSGETGEILTILPIIKRLGRAADQLTGNPDSPWPRPPMPTWTPAWKRRPARWTWPPPPAPPPPWSWATPWPSPCWSARLHRRRFRPLPPRRALGRRLLLLIDDIMHTGERHPPCARSTSLREALLEMTAKGLGMTAVVDAQGGSPACSPTAICAAPWTGRWTSTPRPSADVMTRNPRTIRATCWRPKRCR
jgi:arabinose-5-phosphate isomerase